MSSLSNPPVNYLTYNSLETKKIAIVVDIDGLDYLTSTTIGRLIRYGDPITYGDGHVYGGLIPIGSTPGERQQKILLNLDQSSLTISQRLEPEQGRGAISTISMSFIDKDQYMTQVITPGKIIDEILGKEVKVWIGYVQTNFPEDYYVVWRGRVAQVNPQIGIINLQFTDPNIVKRQNIFYTAQTTLSGALSGGATTIPVASNGDFHRKILGPDGVTYDQTVKTYIKIDDEFMEYQQTGSEATGFGSNSFVGVIRGARATTAVAHDDGATVDAWVEISGLAIDLALKLQMSGWNGPYLDSYAFDALAQTGDISDPVVPSAIVLKARVDAVRDIGLTIGDYITITGDPTPANNGRVIVEGFQDSSGDPNRLVLTNKTFVGSPATPALLALRSQFDVYPTSCGCQLPGWEVDVAGHIFYKDTYLSDLANSYSFIINAEESGKTFIESEIMLPLGAYCLTRQGKLSMGLTKPPIADDRTSFLDHSNVIDPQTIKLQRSINNRKYFNEIDWEYDFDDAGNAVSVRKTVDSDSLSTIGISSVLPISSKGARTVLGFLLVVDRRERFLLGRYAKGAVTYDLKTNFGTGNLIEAGDVVILSDDGQLQIPNMATGERNLGQQLLEVINRSVDLKTGQVSLQLLGGLESLVNDRYATIGPSSFVTTGSTTGKVRIKESFGAIFPVQEQKKWTDYIGLKIAVHSYDYSVYEETTFIGLAPGDDHGLLVSPALSFTPSVNQIVDLARYSTSTDPLDQRLVKLVHCFLDPSVAITSGVDNFSFNVAIGDAPKFNPGQSLLVHSTSYSILSPEVEIQSVLGTLVTVASSLGFTPAGGQKAELIGFADLGGPYRFV